MHNALLLTILLSSTTSTAVAQDVPWKVGLAQRKITPQTPVYLAGYANRNKPFDGVVSDLYVKTLVLQDAQGTRAALVTSDLIGFRASFADTIRDQISQKTGIPSTHVVLNSSHTHTGPSLGVDEKDTWSNMTEEDARQTAAYTRQLMQDVVQTVEEACGKLTPAKLSHGIGVARFVMNRREPTPTGVRLGFNPSGLADRSVPVLRIDAPDGRLLAVLFGAACHNTTLGGNDYFVSADFAGYAQEFIQAQHPGATALFMMGCGGSANPFPRGTTEISRVHGRELGGEVCRLLETKLRPINGPLRVASEMVDLPLAPPPTRERLIQLAAGRSGWEPWYASQMLKRLEAGEELPKHYRCPVAVWQLGEDLTLVGLSGEVVAEYVPLIQDALGPLNLWIAAYCNDVFGYVPSVSTLREGGYETRGMIYGGIGQFLPETQEVLVAKVRELAVKAGRMVPAQDPADQAQQPLRIHMIGVGEYKPVDSLTVLKKHLEEQYCVQISTSFSLEAAQIYKGGKSLPNMESLKEADVMVIFARRMNLPEEQMAIVRNHWEQGKAIVAMRTSSHAFQPADNEIFDQQVLVGHYGGSADYTTPFQAIPAEGVAEHQVLKGVQPINSKGYYGNRPLAKDAIVLQVNDEPQRTIKRPVTWIHTYKGGRTFYTSMGVPTDFEDENFRRLLSNAIFWTAQRDSEKMKK